ncbi:MAG: hypothetical protein ABJ314_10555, partial [Ilumatobacter sp.]|uniref:hypothetical protein n=1 Tax=Ilumatobacter sp. TaxID=1967498 RepID=UPI0032970E24
MPTAEHDDRHLRAGTDASAPAVDAAIADAVADAVVARGPRRPPVVRPGASGRLVPLGAARRARLASAGPDPSQPSERPP